MEFPVKPVEMSFLAVNCSSGVKNPVMNFNYFRAGQACVPVSFAKIVGNSS